MDEETYARTLPVTPPREYQLRDALFGRVWRDRLALIARELQVISIVLLLAGLLLDSDEGLVYGLLSLLGSSLLLVGAGLYRARWRTLLIQRNPAVKGSVIALQPRYLWHEFLRGRAHRSVVLRYRYTLPEGEHLEGRLWLCRCAADRFKVGDQLWICYRPERPSASLPLRVALMHIPH